MHSDLLVDTGNKFNRKSYATGKTYVEWEPHILCDQDPACEPNVDCEDSCADKDCARYWWVAEGTSWTIAFYEEEEDSPEVHTAKHWSHHAIGEWADDPRMGGDEHCEQCDCTVLGDGSLLDNCARTIIVGTLVDDEKCESCNP